MENPQPIDVDKPEADRFRRMKKLARIVALAAVSAAGVLAIGFAVFATYVSELSTPDDVPPADAIIVLTGGQARLDAALGLLETGKGKRLLISGVNPATNPQTLSVATGRDPALFTCCVDLDHAALDTIGNAEESAKWLGNHNYGSVILVTNNYHMPRTMLEMHRLLDGRAAVQPYPVVNTPLNGGGWMTKPQAWRVIFTEYAKFVVALARNALPGPTTQMQGVSNEITATTPPVDVQPQ